MSENTLGYRRLRHALLYQVATTADTERRWTRRRNPRKTDPASGLPDHLYTVEAPGHEPSPIHQRTVRQLDLHGLLSAVPTADEREILSLSPEGERLLGAWTREFGEPDTP
ncbi:hypothetical protein [Amycolatopsis sp. cmx-4-61]|uniref:hypothetical protein n=1 Tax=Amycolatopsis sp. cmx-4-61 TaxID=2790937 RepID=UPI0039790132